MSRARAEWQDPSPTTDPELIAALSSLVELEHAACSAYAAAVTRLEEHLGGMHASMELERHGKRLQQLSDLIRSLGGSAPTARESDRNAIPVSGDEIEYLHDPDQITDALERDELTVEGAYQVVRSRPMAAAIEQALAEIAAI